ncbi:hypothetical protein MKW98_005116 [Papaver atlanticum]|uniref:Myosin N-terminal SH3-like domain-containing protein n=1 Tax=Papaver atlanticum TaxID=357466 RepID=A0AAD4RW72_9MAGN|nr:hypothetical protein MKW98_005116 [Papaver atlanticum]
MGMSSAMNRDTQVALEKSIKSPAKNGDTCQYCGKVSRWVEDPKLAWINGEVTRANGQEVHAKTIHGKTVVANLSKVFPKDTEAPPGVVNDMTKLSYLHEPGFLQNLVARYELI